VLSSRLHGHCLLPRGHARLPTACGGGRQGGADPLLRLLAGGALEAGGKQPSAPRAAGLGTGGEQLLGRNSFAVPTRPHSLPQTAVCASRVGETAGGSLSLLVWACDWCLGTREPGTRCFEHCRGDSVSVVPSMNNSISILGYTCSLQLLYQARSPQPSRWHWARIVLFVLEHWTFLLLACQLSEIVCLTCDTVYTSIWLCYPVSWPKWVLHWWVHHLKYG
jgi:hypothetical protein